MNRQLARLLLVCAAVLPGGCREGVQPFSPMQGRPGGDDPRQLTFSLGDDRDPQWSADGDSIYYHSNRWFDAPGPGTLLRISVNSGLAAPLSDYAQPNPGTHLSTPTVAKDGRLAYLHFVRVLSPAPCLPSDGQDPPGHLCPVEALLDSGMLRVRSPGAVNPATSDPGVAVRYPGSDPGKLLGSSRPLHDSVYPYHIDWQTRKESGELRPSWAPDGSRLVFSNGSQLFTWRPGDALPQAIAGAMDGVSPAWSPDGNWIAFTVIERGASSLWDCLCGGGPPYEHRYRTTWAVLGYRLALIHPDGTGLRLLGDGRDPAWAPDSRTLYVRRASGTTEAIYALTTDAPTVATVVPGTEGGRSPAVSADGTWLAFARAKASGGDFDIWLKRLGN